MSEILRWMIYLYTGLAAAAFAYGVIQMFFLTRYADYQERMLRSFGERGGGLALVIDPQKLQHLSILLCSGLFLFGVLLGAGNLFVGMFLGGVLIIPGLLMPRIVFSILLARRLARISEQLPTGLELLVNSMRAGLTLGVALERNLERMPPDLREELSVVLHAGCLRSGFVASLRRQSGGCLSDPWRDHPSAGGFQQRGQGSDCRRTFSGASDDCAAVRDHDYHDAGQSCDDDGIL